MTEILVAIVVAAGVAGTVLPFLPGIPLIWGATLAYGLIEGFGPAGWIAMTVITLIGGAGIAAGVLVPQRAAWAGGIGLRGQLLAFALAIVGFFVIPVVGAAVGFVFGVYWAAKQRHPDRAGQVTRTTVRAIVVAAGLQFVAGILMSVTWVVWVVVA
ncbi:MAG: DUF456 domain-containing protein [Acidimicrobiia bacterium]|nr:DUF456 domain-containing protein [Acidimicrobiia bacterium]